MLIYMFTMKRTGVKVFNYIEIRTVKSDFFLFVDLCSLRDLGFILFKSLPKGNVYLIAFEFSVLTVYVKFFLPRRANCDVDPLSL